ncbi:MAG: trigger factor [Candidatus Poriferisodalaceae bacterium]
MKTTLSEVPAEEIDDDASVDDEAAESATSRTTGPKVKLSVEVDEDTLDTAIGEAFKKIAREVRIPGFRPGKVPRKVLEKRIGSDYARAQALEDALPRYYAEAVRENDVDVIASPSIDITGGQESGPLTFDAVVEVRPVITISGYKAMKVELPNPEPSDDEVTEQVDAVRSQHAELVEVDRAAATGDNVSIDINGTVDGEALPGLTADDYVYEVGSGGIVPEVDEQLEGAESGDELEFSAPHPVQEDVEIEFVIKVNSVKEQVLPELTDEWVDENTEFDNVEDMVADTRRRMKMVRSFQATSALREKTAEALADLVSDDVPESLVNGEMSDQIQALGMRLQQQGMSIEQWLGMTGQDPETFTTDLRKGAETSAKVDLALRALAASEGMEVTDDQLDEEIDRIAEQLGEDAAEIRKRLEHGDGYAPVRSDLLKRNALEWLTEQVELVDPEGNAIDREALESPVFESTDTGEGDTGEGDTEEGSQDDEDAAESASDSAQSESAEAGEQE